MPPVTASTAKLEAFFFTFLSLSIIGACYGLTSPLFALCQSVVSLSLLWLLWPKNESALFSATRSTYAKYKAMFLELCALVYILCATLSVFARIRAKDYQCDVILVLLRKQAITTIGVFDLAASSAIVAAHVTGHHDICNRIHSRSLRMIRDIQIIGSTTGTLCYQLLQEQSIDLEDQSDMDAAPYLESKKATTASFTVHSASALPTLAQRQFPKTQENQDVEEMDNPDGAEFRERFRHLKRLSMKNNPHKLVHEELRSISARLRWSSLRYMLGFQERPFEDVFVVVPPQVPSVLSPPEAKCWNLPQPHLELSPGKSQLSRVHSPSLNMIDRQNALGIHRLQPFDSDFGLNNFGSKTGSSPAPIFQLRGKIQNRCVKALPDTGSSQNIIDKSLVEQLFPWKPIVAIDQHIDKPLVAPDGETIPCSGKVCLPWTFDEEEEVYEKWFFVVENCSKGVIIGNNFLQETETMDKHRHRLMITKPLDPNSLSGIVASEAHQTDCVRHLVLGRINEEDALASIDTGCEANLISARYAEDLKLEVHRLPLEKKEVEFANGRKSVVLGQVDFKWSFYDTPEIEVPITCHVLSTCIHPIIFGERFAYSEDPWIKHEPSLSQVPSSKEEIGVVGLRKTSHFWLPGNYKLDPQEEVRYQEKKARKERAEARLRSYSQSQSQSHPQTQLQTPPSAHTQASPDPASITPPDPAHIEQENSPVRQPAPNAFPRLQQTSSAAPGSLSPSSSVVASPLPPISKPHASESTPVSQPTQQPARDGSATEPSTASPTP